MRKYIGSTLAVCLLTLAAYSVSLFFVGGTYDVSAQTPSNCAQPSGRSVWARNSTVYVSIGSEITGTQRTQVENALAEWNRANGENFSGVHFEIGVPPYDGANVLLIANGTVYNNPTGGGYNTGSGAVASDIGALTQRNSSDATGQLTNATITFNTGGGLASPGVPGSGPLYDSTASGYDSFFLKILLHELGHTMGLSDASGIPGYDQTARNSVMNGLTSGCPNDNCTFNGAQGNLPTSVTPCDNSTVNMVTNYAYLADNGGGLGGGGGDGGGGGYYYYPCTPYYWVYYESWDGGETWEEVDRWYAGCW